VTTLNERIETTLPIEAVFAYIADFANSQEWDPGVDTAERIDHGPVGVGARYRLGVHLGGRVAPMEYRITIFEPPSRVVLVGSGSGVSAVDEIRFGRTGTGTTIDYTADIRLGGLLRLAQPFLGGAFATVARKAADGMRRTLADRARATADEPAAPR
jgi:carbon monoxide dehydrogenase subunit G